MSERAAAPPPSDAFPFVFTDESGVVTTAATQPFYGVGMLKVADAGRWSDELNLLLDRYVSTHARQGVRVPRNAYEFHFSRLTASSRGFYEQLIDFFVAQRDGYFCALVVDKASRGVDPFADCNGSWDALINFSARLIQSNVAPGERAIVVSDYYQRPRKDATYFERELIARSGGKVVNAAMLDSGASIMLQLVDVLLGCVMFHSKMPRLPAVDADKRAIADRLAAAYGVATLAGASTSTVPNYFRV